MLLYTAAVLLSFAASAAPIARSNAFETKLRTADIVYSEGAMKGARLALIEQPARHAAGVSVPAGVATVYQPAGQGNGAGSGGDKQGGNSELNDDKNDNDSRRGGEDNNDKGGGNESRPDIGGELVTNNEFTTDLQGWDSHSAYVTDEFGPIRASGLSKDGRFAAIHTGYSDNNNYGFIEQSLSVPLARNAGFSMLYNFVSTEFPVWVGTEFNDTFQIVLTGPSGERTFSMAEFLNTSAFTPVTGLPEGILDGWGPGQTPVTGGQTGWKVQTASGLALKSGIYKLRIEIRDVGDDFVDSAVLVDRISLR